MFPYSQSKAKFILESNPWTMDGCNDRFTLNKRGPKPLDRHEALKSMFPEGCYVMEKTDLFPEATL